MSREKQIEEMAKDVWKASCAGHGIECTKCEYANNSTDKYSCVDFVISQNLYNAGYRKQSEWISVDERLPEPNLAVLIYAFFHNQWQIVKGWHSFCDKKFHIANSDYPSLTDIPVSHWMPLPEAPK